MKIGKSLTQLATELEAIKKTTRDFIVPAERIRMDGNGKIRFEDSSESVHTFNPSAWAHDQISGYADVPREYYKRIHQQDTALLALNVNHGLREKAKVESRTRGTPGRMLRTIAPHGETELRALVSPTYRRLDSYDLMNEVLPMMLDSRMDVISTEITDQRVYLKALMPGMLRDIKPGHAVQYGLMVSNSDVGGGALRVEPYLFELICQNGMISTLAIRKFHAGKNLASEDAYELLSEHTKDLTDAAFWAQIRDIVTASMKIEIFEGEVEKLRRASQDRIQNFDIPQVVELTQRAVGVKGESLAQIISAHLANGADGRGLTRWGLANAFTYAAHDDSVGYDEAVSLERAGAKIIELPPNQWKNIAESRLG